MTTPNNKIFQIKSFQPVLLYDWILNISINPATEGICIILFHRYEHTLRCAYVIGQDEATNFIEHIIETYK